MNMARQGHDRMRQIKDVIRSKLTDCFLHIDRSLFLFTNSWIDLPSYACIYIYINYTRCANGKQSRNVYDCTGWDQHQSISVYKTLLAYRQVLSCRVCSNNPFDVDPHHSARLVQTRSMVCSALTGRKLRAGAVEHQDSNKRRQLAGVSAC